MLTEIQQDSVLFLRKTLFKAQSWGHIIPFFCIPSAVLSSALGNLLGQWGIPAFNLPFNVATYVFVASAWSSDNAHFPGPSASVPEAFGVEPLDWIRVCQLCTNIYNYNHFNVLLNVMQSRGMMLSVDFF